MRNFIQRKYARVVAAVENCAAEHDLMISRSEGQLHESYLQIESRRCRNLYSRKSARMERGRGGRIPADEEIHTAEQYARVVAAVDNCTAEMI